MKTVGARLQYLKNNKTKGLRHLDAKDVISFSSAYKGTAEDETAAKNYI